MARDETFKRVQDAGADFLEAARAKAEEFLKELSRAGGDSQIRAQGALDDLVESGRKGTEMLTASIRREVQNQLTALGLATKDDLEALEHRLRGRGRAADSGTTTKKASTSTRGPAKKTGGAAKKTGGPAKKTGGAAKKTGGAAKKTAG